MPTQYHLPIFQLAAAGPSFIRLSDMHFLRAYACVCPVHHLA